jgi:hypothetical protein
MSGVFLPLGTRSCAAAAETRFGVRALQLFGSLLGAVGRARPAHPDGWRPLVFGNIETLRLMFLLTVDRPCRLAVICGYRK